MIKEGLILSMFFFFLHTTTTAKEIDSIKCRGELIEHVLQTSFDASNFIHFFYRDSMGEIKNYLDDEEHLGYQIIHVKHKSLEQYKSFIKEKLLKQEIIDYKEIGILYPLSLLKNSKFSKRWLRRGRDRFIDNFFINNKLKAKYNKPTAKRSEIIAIAYDLGIVISLNSNDGNFFIAFISKCK